MATEKQKQAALMAIRQKIDIADRVGLVATAQNWRDLYANVSNRPAAQIIMAANAAAAQEF